MDWKEIEATESYKALPPEERVKVGQRYFDKRIAGPKFEALPEPEKIKIYNRLGIQGVTAGQESTQPIKSVTQLPQEPSVFEKVKQKARELIAPRLQPQAQPQPQEATTGPSVWQQAQQQLRAKGYPESMVGTAQPLSEIGGKTVTNPYTMEQMIPGETKPSDQIILPPHIQRQFEIEEMLTPHTSLAKMAGSAGMLPGLQPLPESYLAQNFPASYGAGKFLGYAGAGSVAGPVAGALPLGAAAQYAAQRALTFGGKKLVDQLLRAKAGTIEPTVKELVIKPAVDAGFGAALAPLYSLPEVGQRAVTTGVVRSLWNMAGTKLQKGEISKEDMAKALTSGFIFAAMEAVIDPTHHWTEKELARKDLEEAFKRNDFESVVNFTKKYPQTVGKVMEAVRQKWPKDYEIFKQRVKVIDITPSGAPPQAPQGQPLSQVLTGQQPGAETPPAPISIPQYPPALPRPMETGLLPETAGGGIRGPLITPPRIIGARETFPTDYKHKVPKEPKAKKGKQKLEDVIKAPAPVPEEAKVTPPAEAPVLTESQKQFIQDKVKGMSREEALKAYADNTPVSKYARGLIKEKPQEIKEVVKPKEVKPAEEPQAEAKEPWEMTKEEWVDYVFRKGAPGAISKVSGKSLRRDAGQVYAEEKFHESKVRQALKGKKPIPLAVLAEYPDLWQKFFPSGKKPQEVKEALKPQEIKEVTGRSPEENAKGLLGNKFEATTKDLNTYFERYGREGMYVGEGKPDAKHIVEVVADENLKSAPIDKIEKRIQKYKNELAQLHERTYQRTKAGRLKGGSAGALNRDIDRLDVNRRNIKAALERLEKEVARRAKPQPLTELTAKPQKLQEVVGKKKIAKFQPKGEIVQVPEEDKVYYQMIRNEFEGMGPTGGLSPQMGEYIKGQPSAYPEWFRKYAKGMIRQGSSSDKEKGDWTGEEVLTVLDKIEKGEPFSERANRQKAILSLIQQHIEELKHYETEAEKWEQEKAQYETETEGEAPRFKLPKGKPKPINVEGGKVKTVESLPKPKTPEKIFAANLRDGDTFTINGEQYKVDVWEDGTLRLKDGVTAEAVPFDNIEIDKGSLNKPTPAPKPSPAPKAKVEVKPKASPAKIRELADKMTAQIEAKKNPAIGQQTPTRRRASIAANMHAEGEHLERIQAKLYGIADAIDAGTLPDSLKGITNKAQIESLMRKGGMPVPGLHRSTFKSLLENAKGAKGINNIRSTLDTIDIRAGRDSWIELNNQKEVDAIETLIKLAKGKGKTISSYNIDLDSYKRMVSAGIDTSEKFEQAKKDLASLGKEAPKISPKEKQIKDLERELIGSKIPGFFSTPTPLAERMVDLADIKPGDRVLEPSAGKGNIADAIKAKGINPETVERNETLRNILNLKGHNLVGYDFEHFNTDKPYDAIIMNPPFEKGQDMDHVKRAYRMLAPGGRLVAIMSEGTFFRGDRKTSDFRSWLLGVAHAEHEKLPQGTFKESGTGVAARLVTITKSATLTEERGSIIPGKFFPKKPPKQDYFAIAHIMVKTSGLTDREYRDFAEKITGVRNIANMSEQDVQKFNSAISEHIRKEEDMELTSPLTDERRRKVILERQKTRAALIKKYAGRQPEAPKGPQKLSTMFGEVTIKAKSEAPIRAAKFPEGAKPPTKPPGPPTGGTKQPATPSDPDPIKSDEIQKGYEYFKDKWIGEKDWQKTKASVQSAKLQNRIQQTTGEKKYGSQSKDVDKAIQIHIDLKRNPEHLAKFYNDLTPEQKKIVDLSQRLTPQQKAIADEISKQYDEIGTLAKAKGIIRNKLENYAARVWKVEPPKRTSEQYRKFGTSTRHAKARTFETILEGWANDYELKVEGATNNLAILKEEVHNVIQDKNLITQLKKLKTIDGDPLISTYQLSGYERVEHPGFKMWKWKGKVETDEERATILKSKNIVIDEEGNVLHREEIYAPKAIAKNLNNIMGVSKIKDIPGVPTITKYNAVTKAWILQSTFFHHLAGGRSFYFGSKPSEVADNFLGSIKNMSPGKVYKAGLKALMDLEPEVELLVRNGLTVGEMQDWEESILREEDTFVGRVLDKYGATKAIKDKVNAMREEHADFLFKKFMTGLKVKATLIELQDQMRRHPNINPNEAAKRAANLINDDFGGLHLKRMGRNPTVQHIFRIFALAPDWTESNIRSMVKAFQKGDEGAVYRRFWRRVFMKCALVTLILNALLHRGDMGKAYKKAWKAGGLKWLDVDVTPVYKALGGKSRRRKYFSVAGHFRDPIKFTVDPIRSAHGKGSVVYKSIFELITGEDYAGRKYTDLERLLKKGKTVEWKPFGRRSQKWATMPSYAIEQVKGTQPVQIQNLINWMEGEMDGFDAVANSLGLGIRTTYK